jgi:hypothetical protein
VVEGWIKLYRKLIENPIFLKPELLQLFIYCLLKANHETQRIIFNGQEIEIKPGQFITGRNAMAKDLKQNPKSTYNRLQILKNIEILDIKTNNKFSLVTVRNYELYQSQETKKDSKKDNQRTTRGQPEDTNKNDKNDKNEKNIYIGLSENMKNAINDFIEMRKKIRKPMTERAIQIMLKKLDGLAKDETTKIAILEQSTERGWLSVFPLKEDKPAQKPPSQATNFKQRTYSDEFYKKILNRF